MHTQKKKSCLRLLLFGILFCCIPAMCWAGLAIDAKVVSGSIVKKDADHSVTLDNGVVYHPSRDSLVIETQVGQSVTLKYVVEAEDKHVFFEYAPGQNAIQVIQPVPPTKTPDPK